MLKRIKALDNYPGLIVCSAGNDNYDDDDGNYYPASWNLDNLIKVGACTLESEKCEYSSYGADTIDLFSVGEYIYSTYSKQQCNNSACQKYETHISTGYHSLRGTSMATPFVTGVAAILLAIDPTLTALELKSIIEGTVVECDALIDECETGGRLNAYNAVMTLLDHSNHSKSYTQKSAEEHNTICNVCNCTYPEEHVQFRGIEIPNNISVHTATCRLCNYTGSFEHNWVWVSHASTYRCNVCTATSSIIPRPMSNSLINESDEMLAVLPPSDDKEKS